MCRCQRHVPAPNTYQGQGAQSLRAKDGVRRGIPTCRLTERLGDVREWVQAAGADGCVVLNDAGVVLGDLRGDALDADPEMTVEEAMDPGPTTIRPHAPRPYPGRTPLAASVLAVPHYRAGRASQGFPAIGSVTRPRNGRWHALSVG
jgi:hypothetical protein